MSGRRPAILALTSYLFLALLPLAIALVPPRPGRAFLLELSMMAGFIGFGQMAVQFALIARFQRISRPLGIDLLMQYHRQVGAIALLFVLAHPIVLVVHRPASIALLDPFGGDLSSRAGVYSVLALLLLVALSWGRRLVRLGYEAWRVSHALLGAAAVLLGLVHIARAGTYSDARWKLIALTIWSLALIGLIAWLRLIKPFSLRRRPWEIAAIHPDAARTWTVVLAPMQHEGMRFAPGQFAWVKIGVSPWNVEEHPFSFSSSAESPGRVELGIKELGDFTSTIGRILPGTAAWLDGPYGSFSTDFHPATGYLFIAGGIGISPILSILRTLADREDRRPHALVYACSAWDRVAFRSEIELLRNRLVIDVVYVLEQPHEGWEGPVGYVTREVLQPLVRAGQELRTVLACGPDPMLTSVERLLHESGMPEQKIVMERFNLV